MRIQAFICPFERSELGNRLFVDPRRGCLPETRAAVQNAVFGHLRNAGAERGIDFFTIDFFPEKWTRHYPAIFIFMFQWPYQHLLGHDEHILSAYHIWEPPILAPIRPRDQFNVLDRISADFRRVYSVSTLQAIREVVPMLPASLPLRREFFPQPYNGVIDGLWLRKKTGWLVLIANYQTCCLRGIELYSQRVRSVGRFGAKGCLDLYGQGWDVWARADANSYRARTLRFVSSLSNGTLRAELTALRCRGAIRRALVSGHVQNKLDVLSRYTFAICYESSRFQGFITEKMFDCLAVGTVPVYWGAPEIEEVIPKSCFIHRQDFANNKDLHQFLRGLTSGEIEKYRNAGREYLSSRQYRSVFSKEAFAEQVLADINEDIAATPTQRGPAPR